MKDIAIPWMEKETILDMFEAGFEKGKLIKHVKAVEKCTLKEATAKVEETLYEEHMRTLRNKKTLKGADTPKEGI